MLKEYNYKLKEYNYKLKEINYSVEVNLIVFFYSQSNFSPARSFFDLVGINLKSYTYKVFETLQVL